MRLATFNAENLFERPAAMNLPKWTDGKKILQDFSELNDLIAQATSSAKRKRQAQRARRIYEDRRTEGCELIAIVGDFNDPPDSDSLKPLLKNGSDLIDAMSHPKFAGDGRPGTYATGSKSGKIDYILLSPALAGRVTAGGIERRGVWGGEHGTLFPHLPEITRPVEAASDHAAVWVDFQ
jgi:endonuclease/exonuclease/phosphatase family metal-dependent hydrolase